MNARECQRCLLTEKVPGVKLDHDGLCSVCSEYDRVYGTWRETQQLRLAALKKALAKAKDKNRPYDVLVPISGGKDSTYILYLLRRLYRLKCLAVTWDNGFLSNLARGNIRNACEILEVDHIYFNFDKSLLNRLYRHYFLKTGFFCPVCMRGIYVAQMRTQIAFNIPLAVKGTSRRTEEHISPEFFLSGDISFMENVLKGSPLEEESGVLLEQSGFLRSPRTIQLPDYLEWDYTELYETITKELKWQEESPKTEHGDCLVSNIVTYLRQRKFPALIPEMLRFSKLVTCGQMTKEQARRELKQSPEKIQEPKNLRGFLDDLGMSRAEMEEVLEDPLRHLKYLKPHSRIFRRMKALKRKRLKFV